MPRDLLWIDSRAGLAAGVGVLGLSAWLSPLYGLPRALLLVTAAANIGYGTYSGWLRTRRRRPRTGIVVLLVANATWALACLLAAVHYAPTATAFGVAHLAGEGIIVGTLAALEWRARAALENSPTVPDALEATVVGPSSSAGRSLALLAGKPSRRTATGDR